jgi:single-stranded DNA-binding protein
VVGKGIDMNKVILNGKITRINECEKVIYFTICVRSGNEYEYIPITTFNTIFFKRYFEQGKWICVEGHLHTNKHNGTYTTEIIADSLNFSGDANDLDKEVAEIFRQADELSNLSA